MKKALLNLIYKTVFNNNQKLKAMSEQLDALQAEVSETNTVVNSAITLIKGISQKLKDAGTDPAKLQALTSELDASNAALAEAVAENTAAAEEI